MSFAVIAEATRHTVVIDLKRVSDDLTTGRLTPYIDYTCKECCMRFTLPFTTEKAHKILLDKYLDSRCHTTYWTIENGNSKYYLYKKYENTAVDTVPSLKVVIERCIYILHLQKVITDNEAGYAYILLEGLDEKSSRKALEAEK